MSLTADAAKKWACNREWLGNRVTTCLLHRNPGNLRQFAAIHRKYLIRDSVFIVSLYLGFREWKQFIRSIMYSGQRVPLYLLPQKSAWTPRKCLFEDRDSIWLLYLPHSIARAIASTNLSIMITGTVISYYYAQ